MAIRVEPVVLEGSVVRLEPAEARHASSLARHCELNLFDLFVTIRPVEATEAGLADFVAKCRAMPDVLTFAIVLRASGEAIGTTSYLDIRPEHDALEIGMTWIATSYQGTKVNPECKLLMVGHAIEVLGCERVQLKTDARNLHSQRAIEKLGAMREGVLRKYGKMPDGFMRDTVMYSILPSEWPSVKLGLERRLTP